MRSSLFQKIALFCVATLILLIFMGAVVRATGSGLGCPDWPKCWGCYIPPTSADQIDTTQLDLEKYKKKLAQHGGDISKLDSTTVIDYFDPVKTWIEFINRLCTTPLALGTLAMFFYAHRLVFSQGKHNDLANSSGSSAVRKKKRYDLLLCAYLSVLIVLINAWMGKRVVETGLKPGVITTHMALAILLLCIFVYTYWAGSEGRKHYQFEKKQKMTFSIGWVLFILIVAEGVMGSQVRELTDELQRTHVNEQRSEWSEELEHSLIYVIHRSFSWLVLLATLVFGYLHLRFNKEKWDVSALSIIGIIFAQMTLGLVLAQFGVFPMAQILHIGLSSLLVTAMFYWLLCAQKEKGTTAR